MRLLALKEVEIYEPPYHNSLEGIVEWVKPVTISVKGEEGIVGGIMIHGRLLVTTMALEDPIVKVQFADSHKVVEAIATIYDGEHDFFLSFFAMDEKDELPDWVGLPTRQDPITGETFLFSLIHDHGKDRIVRYRSVPEHESVAVAKRNKRKDKKLMMDGFPRNSTYPLVDAYGYLVGLNIGVSHGETICQTLSLKGAKL